MAEDGTPIEWLNYHHLRHFWVIARRRSLTRAARDLNISPSTLSQQLGCLEDWLQQPLFERRGRELHLTEGGRMALEYAEIIFRTGNELLDRLRRRHLPPTPVLRIGAVGPLSKNLQYDFIEPLLSGRKARVLVVSGPLDSLIGKLREHLLDLVLSNIPMRTDQEVGVFNHSLGEMPVFLAGRQKATCQERPFPQCLEGVSLFLPTQQSHVRADFDLLLAEAGVEPDIAAEVDDMALLRLLALSGHGLALVSAIVLERELNSKMLRSVFRVPGLSEKFYAITLRRRFADPWLEEVVQSFRQRLKVLAQLPNHREKSSPNAKAAKGSGP
jgi:LysR family transcriptional activator of nhaA